MRRALLHREDARVEVVEAFDGLVGGHADRQAIGRGGGKENRVAATPLCLVLGAWCLVLGAWCLVLGALFFVLCGKSFEQGVLKGVFGFALGRNMTRMCVDDFGCEHSRRSCGGAGI